jgi:hypothetical protein
MNNGDVEIELELQLKDKQEELRRLSDMTKHK